MYYLSGILQKSQNLVVCETVTFDYEDMAMKMHMIRETISDNFLETFNRYQETKKIYYLDDDGGLGIKDEYYIDDWDSEKKSNIIQILNYYLVRDGVIVAIKDNKTLLGFAALNGKKMGSKNQYLNLGFIHVSYEYRGIGIGKTLFESICREARRKGAEKLYIGANPAVDTINFYQSMGCQLAQEIVYEIYDHEPLDLQLEYGLDA